MNEVMDDVKMEDIPTDFPRVPTYGSIAGAQGKLLLVAYRGKFYTLGLSPPEIYRRWLRCEDFAQQLTVPAAASKVGKRAHMTEDEILAQYVPRMVAQRWGTVEEMEWVVNRAGVLLGWRKAA